MSFVSADHACAAAAPAATADMPALSAPVARLVAGCHRLLSERGESNSTSMAREVLNGFAALGAEGRLEFFAALQAGFNPDPQRVLMAAEHYARSPGAAELITLTQAAEPARQELLRRLNRAPGGTAVIIEMRRSLLDALRQRPELAAVEADFQHLLNSWFNPGFLQMEQVDWRSSAALLEKIIQHEAVHEIDGWNDLRRRLQPDRRCFAFFHPQLPGEPLIFVEVALVPEMPRAVAPLIDPRSQPLDPKHFRVAAFYSISNCQPGLRGVSLGNFLIKRVAEQLHSEFPQIRTFCTLSPVPGFTAWLAANGGIGQRAGLKAAQRERLGTAMAVLREAGLNRSSGVTAADMLQTEPATRLAALELARFYLQHESVTPRGDPVAKFHLGNGARLQRLNWAADLSAKGTRQSLQLMVNYLYDLRHVEDYHERFVHGEVVASRLLVRPA